MTDEVTFPDPISFRSTRFLKHGEELSLEEGKAIIDKTAQWREEQARQQKEEEGEIKRLLEECKLPETHTFVFHDSNVKTPMGFTTMEKLLKGLIDIEIMDKPFRSSFNIKVARIPKEDEELFRTFLGNIADKRLNVFMWCMLMYAFLVSKRNFDRKTYACMMNKMICCDTHIDSAFRGFVPETEEQHRTELQELEKHEQFAKLLGVNWERSDNGVRQRFLKAFHF